VPSHTYSVLAFRSPSTCKTCISTVHKPKSASAGARIHLDSHNLPVPDLGQVDLSRVLRQKLNISCLYNHAWDSCVIF